jgi:hypothetical protein
MMPDRIGIIGNTQGVKASSRPKPKKLARVASGAAAGQQAGDAAGFVVLVGGQGAVGPLAAGRRLPSARARKPPAAAAGCGDGEALLLRRVADADVGAALAGELQLEGRLAGGDGQRNDQLAAVDLDFAEGVVLLGLARRQAGSPKLMPSAGT